MSPMFHFRDATTILPLATAVFMKRVAKFVFLSHIRHNFRIVELRIKFITIPLSTFFLFDDRISPPFFFLNFIDSSFTNRSQTRSIAITVPAPFECKSHWERSPTLKAITLFSTRDCRRARSVESRSKRDVHVENSSVKPFNNERKFRKQMGKKRVVAASPTEHPNVNSYPRSRFLFVIAHQLPRRILSSIESSLSFAFRENKRSKELIRIFV